MFLPACLFNQCTEQDILTQIHQMKHSQVKIIQILCLDVFGTVLLEEPPGDGVEWCIVNASWMGRNVWKDGCNGCYGDFLILAWIVIAVVSASQDLDGWDEYHNICLEEAMLA